MRMRYYYYYHQPSSSYGQYKKIIVRESLDSLRARNALPTMISPNPFTSPVPGTSGALSSQVSRDEGTNRFEFSIPPRLWLIVVIE